MFGLGWFFFYDGDLVEQRLKAGGMFEDEVWGGDSRSWELSYAWKIK